MLPVSLVRRLLAVTALWTLAGGSLAAQNPTWVHAFQAEKVADAMVLPNGHLGVLTDSGFAVLAEDDGRELYRYRRVCCYIGQQFSSFAGIFTPDSVRLIELDEGRTLWDMRKTLPLDSISGFAVLSERNLLLGYGPVGASGYRVVGASLDSGVVWWQADSLFARVPELAKRRKDLAVTEWHPPLFDSDTTMVLFPRRGGPMRLDTRTGALLWRVDSLSDVEPPLAREGYAAMALDTTAGVVLVPFESYLMAVRVADGHILWRTPAKFPSRLAEIQPTSNGYLVRGYFKGDKPSPKVGPFVDLLDPATGSSRWPAPVRDIDDASAMAVVGDTVWLAGRGSLVGVALATGARTVLAQYKLKSDEMPATLEPRDGKLIVTSPHNLVGVMPSGEVRYQLHYPPPGSSLFSKIVGATLLVGLAAVGPNTIYIPPPKTVADPRWTRVIEARRYLYILTGAKDLAGTTGFSVVRLEKATGKEVGRVWVNDRSPDFRLDGASGMLYLIRDRREIAALPFEATR
jgi:hypothetical protein